MSFNFTICSKNPADISAEEAEELGKALRRLDADINVRTEVKPREGMAVTWAEIVIITLQVAGPILAGLKDKVLAKVTDSAIEWARRRYEGKRKGARRPPYIDIYGPDGEIIKSVEVKNAEDKGTDRTDQHISRLKKK
jgi:hypothetical protein